MFFWQTKVECMHVYIPLGEGAELSDERNILCEVPHSERVCPDALCCILLHGVRQIDVNTLNPDFLIYKFHRD